MRLALLAAAIPTAAMAQAGEAETFWLAPDLVAVVIVGAAGALALAGGLWALAEYQGTLKLRRALRTTSARARALLSLRDQLLGAGREAVVAWGADLDDPLSFGGGLGLLDTCLSGPDATELATALDALAESGAPFAMVARGRDGHGITVRGRAAGSYAALFLEEESQAAKLEPDFRAALDALPLPVWLRGSDLAMRFANRAFLTATGAPSLEAALESNMALDRSERDLASTARNRGETVEAKRYAVIGGQRRALAFTLTPVGDGAVTGSAIDVTALAEAESRLQQHIDAHADTLDRLATAVAIFGPDRKLNFYNRAYVGLWKLAETWLDTHPTEGQILDRLRELRRLPEQPDFRAWKREHLALFERVDDHPEELWHLPGGKTLRVVAQPHPFGGLIFLFEDVSDQLRLESSYNTLIEAQKATLDTLREGVAVFGPDGRLRLYNSAFKRIWQLEPAELSGEPHLNRIADACAARFGQDQAWEIVTTGVTSATPERQHEYSEVKRSDGMMISVTLAPLPDGATLASFADVTDRFRIETALRERNQALEATDNLKSEFVNRVSYELRTPLNSILGFAELLKGGTAGPLSPRQAEYADAVVAASKTLRDLIDDILDLSQVEAGAMSLDLEKIDLYALLATIANHAREWAAKIGLTLKLDCPPGAGTFVADKKRIGQVIFNLLSNALKYTPRGGTITMGGGITDEDVHIYVADTGPGMPPDMMSTAFERFSAKGGGARGARDGAGLGLALVNRFVELHNGWVKLESAPGEGTKVTCHFPRDGQRAPAKKEQSAARA